MVLSTRGADRKIVALDISKPGPIKQFVQCNVFLFVCTGRLSCVEEKCSVHGAEYPGL